MGTCNEELIDEKEVDRKKIIDITFIFTRKRDGT